MTRAGLVLRLGIMAAVFVALAPVQVWANRGNRSLAGRLPITFHRLFLRLFGIRVAVIGTPPAPGEPTLILANHVSWLDIPVMASSVPLSFIAKQEIAGWPVFGPLARMQRCVFIDRGRKSSTAEVNAVVGRRLAGGESILLYPEGTTGDGVSLLPFRSAIVGAAQAALVEDGAHPIRLQPLAIAYRARNGLPLGRREMPAVAWYGDMELAPHLSAFVKDGPLDVALVWGDTIPFHGSSDRKDATAAAEAALRDALVAARATTPAELFLPGRKS